MAELAIAYDSASARAALKATMDKATRRTKAALLAIAQQAAEEIKTRGIADIQSAGRYGSDWTSGLRVAVVPVGEGEAVIQTSHTKPYYSFLNRGGPIKGSPLLWLPTSNLDTDLVVPPSQYPGKLVSVVSRTGIPLLIDPNVESSRRAGAMGEVMYTGEPFVVIPQKFHILDIIRDVARGLKGKYKIAYASAS